MLFDPDPDRMKMPNQLKRRGFIGAALVAFGAAAGTLIRRRQNAPRPRAVAPSAETNRFAYDVSEFEKTDPALLRFRPGPQWETGFQRVKRLGRAADGGIWVAGDRSVKLFDFAGALKKQIDLDRPPHCLHVSNDQVYIGFANHLEIYDLDGKRVVRTPRLGENTFLTAVAVHQQKVFLADAGEREVIVWDGDSGKRLTRFGKKDSATNNPGFNVPSPYFDLAIASDDRLRIVNPGRLRVETYSLEGEFISAWGEPGMRIDRFCGCCNPVFFALTKTGNFITSEKGIARINLYSADGNFQGAVAGPELLLPANRSQKEPGAEGRNQAFDVTADERGRVFVLDPHDRTVRIFEPLEEDLT